MISTLEKRAKTLRNYPQTWFLFLIVALALFAGAIVIWVTPWGPRMGSDSVTYLLSAKNLVDKGFLGVIWGQGLIEPLMHFPPLLTFLVAGFYLFGFDLVSAMRLIDAVTFGILIFSIGWLGYKVTGRRSLAIQVCLILGVAPTVFRAYTSAMSEGLFYLCMLTSLLLILAYFENSKKAYLVGSAVLAAASLLTRYIGVAVFATCLVGIVLLSRASWKKRFVDAIIFALASLGISFLWFLWVYNQRGQLGGRLLNSTLNLGTAARNFALALLDLIWNWMTLNLGTAASFSTQKIIIATFFILLTVVLLLVYRKFALHEVEDNFGVKLARWCILFGLATACYIICYLLAYAFTSPAPALIDRIAFPIFFTTIISILGLMHLLIISARSSRILRFFPWIFTLVLITAYLPSSVSWAKELKSKGSGYTSKAWRQSEWITAIQNLPAGIPVVTNEPDAVIFLTGRESIRMTEALGQAVKNPGQSYGTDPNDLGESVFRRGGALVIFPSFYWQIEPVYGKDTQSRLEALTKGLSIYKIDGNTDTGIYFYSPAYVP